MSHLRTRGELPLMRLSEGERHGPHRQVGRIARVFCLQRRCRSLGCYCGDFTDTAQGSALGFFTTAVGTVSPSCTWPCCLPETWVSAGGRCRTAARRRLTNFKCVRPCPRRHVRRERVRQEFCGTGLIGTCVSDRRFKKDITPFGRPRYGHGAAAGALLLARGQISGTSFR
jgi:hypothetical protein